MNLVLVLAGLAVCLVLLRRQWREEADEPITPWHLVRAVLLPLGLGIALLVVTLRGLIHGEVHCYSKGGGCPAPVAVRALDPTGYWVNIGFFAVMAAVLFWFAWRGWRRWRESRHPHG